MAWEGEGGAPQKIWLPRALLMADGVTEGMVQEFEDNLVRRPLPGPDRRLAVPSIAAAPRSQKRLTARRCAYLRAHSSSAAQRASRRQRHSSTHFLPRPRSSGRRGQARNRPSDYEISPTRWRPWDCRTGAAPPTACPPLACCHRRTRAPECLPSSWARGTSLLQRGRHGAIAVPAGHEQGRHGVARGVLSRLLSLEARHQICARLKPLREREGVTRGGSGESKRQLVGCLCHRHATHLNGQCDL